MEKWLFCKSCNRVFRYTQEDLKAHLNCPRGAIIKPYSVPVWHCLYQPELLLDSVKFHWEEFREWLKSW